MREKIIKLYNKEDCEALDKMSKEEVADILENIPGSWTSYMPQEYYDLIFGHKEEAELDFERAKNIRAIQLAAAWLREINENEKSNKEG